MGGGAHRVQNEDVHVWRATLLYETEFLTLTTRRGVDNLRVNSKRGYLQGIQKLRTQTKRYNIISDAIIF